MVSSVSYTSKYLISRLKICYKFASYPSFSTIPSEPNSSFDFENVKYPSNSKPSTNPHDFDQKSVGETLSLYVNDWKRALEFFKWVESDCGFKHSTETYNRMIDILGKFFEFNLSWDLIAKMREDRHSMPNHVTFRIMFKRYVSAHLVQEAIDTYYRKIDLNLKDEASFFNLIDALCEYKHVIEAEDLCLGKSKSVILRFKGNSTKIYNMILRGWFKMGWWSKCNEFWEEMDRRGVHKDLLSYSIYMDIQCKSGKPWKSVQIYKEMKKKKIELDVVAYNTVILAIGLSEGVDVSVRLFREMRDLGCEPNVATFNTIIKLLCKNERFGEAYDMLQKMSKSGCAPNVISYNCIFRCLSKPNDILKLFDRMVDTGVRPRMETYVMLMRKFGRWGFLRAVFIVWRKMEELGDSPNEFAYNALIDALVDKNMLDMARKYDQEMFEKGLSPKLRVELEKQISPRT